MSTDERVRSFLRPSESLQCLVDVELATVSTRAAPPDYTLPRLIAVVTHHTSHDTEVGSLLVFHATDARVRVVDALPVTQHFALAVAQTGPLDSQTENVSRETWSAWLLTIRRDAQDTRPLAFLVGSRDTQKLQSFTTECRRLKEIATATHLDSTDFTWIEAYVSDPSFDRLDLRLRKQPLHTRLSPSIAGLPGDDISDISVVRRDWIEQTATKQASMSGVNRLKLRLGTFNVNGRTPSQDLSPWLRSSRSQANTGWISPLVLSPIEVSPDPLHQELRKDNLLAGMTAVQDLRDPDVLVLAFQELDLSTEALLYTTSTLKEDEWLTAIFAGFGEKRVLYEKLTSRQLVGMLLIVIVKKTLVPCFTDVRSCDAGSGIMGFMGNKGATAIRLEFTPKLSSDPLTTTCRSTVLTFVNAHLAASDEMEERRNYDFHELSGRLAFPPNQSDATYLSNPSATNIHDIYQSDMLFWMGGEVSDYRPEVDPHTSGLDLNYRLDLTDGDTRNLLLSHVSGIDSLQTLLSYDQLRAAIRSKKAFAGFTEQPITHMPTYRLALAVSKDRLGYDIKRKPAWTDRILYMVPPDVRMTQLAYRNHPEISMSDHQPVSADFDISLALIDQSHYENAVSTLRRELAGFESSERGPKIKIQSVSVDFGNITYKRAVHREVVIQNERDIPCVFRFVGTGAESESIAPSWLRITPMVGLLRPHESVSILLQVYVDDKCAAKLNLGPSMLECTLILHTALGKDDFIALSGHYQHTCFATTLARLTRLTGPIRKLKSPEQVTLAGQAINAPREIVRLINWMMTHVSASLFEHPAQEDLCHVIRECLDTGDEFPPEGPEGNHVALVAAFAHTLVSFLDSLAVPVVPAPLHAQCLQAKDKDEAFEVLNVFPHESINVWISLTAFLHYVAQQSGSEDESDVAGPTKAQRLASIFAPILLRDDPTSAHPRVSPVGKRQFLLHFIG